MESGCRAPSEAFPMSHLPLARLTIPVHPLTPSIPVSTVADLFLSDRCRDLLCLPIVRDGHLVGTISRYTIMRIFLQHFGRELYGQKPVERFMNKSPIQIEQSMDVEEASLLVRSTLTLPITEDFAITEKGRYVGMGVVLSLLEVMEHKIAHRSEALARANHQLKSSQAQLVQSEKMASLGQMVAGVAHEINTPLGYVRNNLELALDFMERTRGVIDSTDHLIETLLNPASPESQTHLALESAATEISSHQQDAVLDDMRTLFDDSLHGLQQITDLVADLRNFSRVDKSRMESANLNDCIESALNIGRNVIKHKADVEKYLADIPFVECSASQINQVLLNILTNAAQAIKGHGLISIYSGVEDDQVLIRICDNGCGMPETVKNRIFDPFFTTKPVGEGTGLGLAISFQIIEQHGGRIEVLSRENEGTEFRIYMPLRKAEELDTSQRQATA
ncbi:MAG: ATPase [Gammaproteobacteria bacterium HGW-Gammaproteobacteria-14]|nr:MAG: ATPase [Gammaproteobacteria bacterium HGW-Gammaproteobacteria-14]